MTAGRSFWIPVYAGMTIVLLCASFSNDSAAETQPQPVESAQLQKCLQRADDLPDMAAAEAQAWLKKSGGNDAHLCRAFAQSNRGMHSDAAREFWFLASFYDKRDPARAIVMHNFSGQEFLRGKDVKNAGGQYSDSLKLDSHNVAALIGHAQTRAAEEKYWDALEDLNRAIKAEPDNIAALRQRGLAWAKLGNESKAVEDFDRAESLTAAPPAP